MAVILCPHCNRTLELDDGGSGLFDCPHCGEEFYWGEMNEETGHNIFTWLDRAASTIYLQIGVLLLLYPVTVIYPDLFAIFGAGLFVPFISWGYRRQRRRRKRSQDLTKESLEGFNQN